MPKRVYLWRDEVQERRPPRGQNIWPILCGILISPLLYEGGAVIAANWRTMSGECIEAQTPVLDALHETANDALFGVRRRAAALFRDPPWKPIWIVGLGLGIACGCGVYLLRRIEPRL